MRERAFEVVFDCSDVLKSRCVVEVVKNFYQLEGSQGGYARDVLCVDCADSSL